MDCSRSEDSNAKMQRVKQKVSHLLLSVNRLGPYKTPNRGKHRIQESTSKLGTLRVIYDFNYELRHMNRGKQKEQHSTTQHRT